MAEHLYLVTRGTPENRKKMIDGVHAVLINSDDGGTDAQIIAEAVAQCAAGGLAIPSGYFDTVLDVGDLTAGPLKDDTDCYVFGPELLLKVEA